MGRKNETTFPAATAAIAKPSRTTPPTTAAQVLISSMTDLEVWTCTAPLDHPLRRAFVDAQTALYMGKTEPFAYDAKWKAETLRAMRTLLQMPGSVLFQFCRTFFQKVEEVTEHQVLDPDLEEDDVLGVAFSEACDSWKETVEDFKTARIPTGRPRSLIPEALVALVAEIRKASLLSTDELRLHTDRHVSEWAAEQTGGLARTFLRAIQGQREKPPSR